jgi:nitroreductase/NAD-dependent dihydropyrimidine dehydrogenase PreA subunit
MDLRFHINQELCVQCGECADDCPYHIITLAAGFPALNHGRTHHCIGCQHCMAICPTGALSIFGLDPQASLPLPEGLPSAAQTEALIRGRRSIRRFLPDPLSAEEIDRLLRTVANAPTGKNRRQTLVTLVDNPNDMDRLRQRTMTALRRVVAERRLPREASYFRHVVRAWDQGRDIIFREAPHMLIASSPREATSGEADPFIALSYFELMAASLGLGTVWCGYARWALQSVVPELGRRLGIPSDHRSMYAVMFGWPAVRYARAVQREVQGLHRVRPADLEDGL